MGLAAGSLDNTAPSVSTTAWLATFARSVSAIFSGSATLMGPQIAYWTIYFLLVVAFTYFYTDVMIRNQNLPENLQKNGGFIPGIRPGKRTAEFINRVVRRITLVGALFLGGIAVLPGVISIGLQLAGGAGGQTFARNLLLISGGSLIIVVGVVIDTLRQLEAQLIMRHRDAFIK